MSTSMSASTAPISSSSTPDQRNLQWKSSNIGAKLLGKMGWKDGQAVGKRQRHVGGGDDGNGGASNFSSEGLRLKKRIDGLGVGAEKSMPSHALGNNNLHADFSSVLASVSQEHNSSLAKSSKKKKKEKKPLSLPKNKTTCHKVRRAKFQEKTEDDLKCIFGSSSIAFPVVTSGDSSAVSGEIEQTVKKRKSKDKEDRKSRKKEQKL
jgi:G-patch domain